MTAARRRRRPDDSIVTAAGLPGVISACKPECSSSATVTECRPRAESLWPAAAAARAAVSPAEDGVSLAIMIGAVIMISVQCFGSSLT